MGSIWVSFVSMRGSSLWVNLRIELWIFCIMGLKPSFATFCCVRLSLAIKQEEIHCLQAHDVKEAVHELTANSNVACFSSQGTGVKIYNWSGVIKHINFNKTVKSLAMFGSKLYCGCTGYSILEVDLHKYTAATFYSGVRKILGKQTIHSLCIHNLHMNDDVISLLH
ncbi:putative E3 ubiquitin-protein ligase LIN-2 [Camellia sinensis]|uniref:putative E3 ubiquitin-protein ligase LIN-2 n=1 Tax=Camellia sinensis TaxID=4442 RepID=UPI001035E27F|nr:putative E3 ubiquitin-protein ligase LIN-2 [Camellia sinensis]